MTKIELDGTDLAILDILQADAGISNQALAERVFLSPSPCLRRVRRLEELGVIRGYHAEVDYSALGIGLRAITELHLGRDTDPLVFEAELARTREVQSAMHVTGALDYVLLLACPDVATLDRLLSRWKAESGVEQSTTRILLRDVDLTRG